jgi:hypothetical protein
MTFLVPSINTIIILTQLPFIDRHYQIWGVETLIQNGFSVEVWDISPFLYDVSFGLVESISKKDFDYKLRKFSTEKEISDALSNLNNSVFINVFIGFFPKIEFIYLIISKKEIAYAVPLFNALPFSHILSFSTSHRNINASLSSKISRNKIKEFIKWIKNHLVYKRPYFLELGIQPASLAIAGGVASLYDKQYPYNNRTKILWTHCIDYNISLQNVLNNENYLGLPDNCGVFLDEFLPFHLDFKIQSVDPPLSPEEYYPKLCRFFSYIEKKYGTTIIIASHPSATYDQLPNFFEGRKIIKDKTAQLVKESSFVMLHASTSINYAIIYQKPIILLTLDKLCKPKKSTSRIGELTENMASLLQKVPFNLDEEPSIILDSELKINEDAYRMYKNLYIKKQGSEEKDMWQIFADYINQM